MDFVDTAHRLVSGGDMKEKIKFVIVGDTPWFFPKNHLRELEDYAEKLGVRDSFHLYRIQKRRKTLSQGF